MNAIEEHKKIYTVVIQHYLNEVRPKFLPNAAGQDRQFCVVILLLGKTECHFTNLLALFWVASPAYQDIDSSLFVVSP